MAFVRRVRLPIGIATIAVGLGVAAANSASFMGIYREIFPSDPAKRTALEVCFLQDHRFNRLDADERKACYAHALLSGNSAAAAEAPREITSLPQFGLPARGR